MLRIAVKLIPSLYAVSSFCKCSPEMSVNYSTNSSHFGSFKNCLSPAPLTSYTLLLPVFIFVLFVGYQRWRKQRSVVTATAMTSHSDIFTYNLVFLEIFSVVATVLFWLLHKSRTCIYGCHEYISYLVTFTDAVSPPHLCGSLSGSCSPSQISAA